MGTGWGGWCRLRPQNFLDTWHDELFCSRHRLRSRLFCPGSFWQTRRDTGSCFAASWTFTPGPVSLITQTSFRTVLWRHAGLSERRSPSPSDWPSSPPQHTSCILLWVLPHLDLGERSGTGCSLFPWMWWSCAVQSVSADKADRY